MSIDKSLVSKNKLVRERNVYSRSERIEFLQHEGGWDSGDSVFGLPKVKIRRLKRKAKKVKEEKTDETAKAAAPAAK